MNHQQDSTNAAITSTQFQPLVLEIEEEEEEDTEIDLNALYEKKSYSRRRSACARALTIAGLATTFALISTTAMVLLGPSEHKSKLTQEPQGIWYQDEDRNANFSTSTATSERTPGEDLRKPKGIWIGGAQEQDKDATPETQDTTIGTQQKSNEQNNTTITTTTGIPEETTQRIEKAGKKTKPMGVWYEDENKQNKQGKKEGGGR